MTNRKSIVALINDCIYIDPADVGRVDIDKINTEVVKKIGKPLSIVIAPIQEWMPESGTKAIMDEAVKSLTVTKNTYIRDTTKLSSRNARRLAIKKNKHGKYRF